jgi:hypothetical protein
MKTPKWICAACRQPFTRRWNANRHCNNKHSGYLENIVSFTDYVIDRQGYDNLNNFNKDKSSHPNNFVNNQILYDQSFYANKASYNLITNPFEYFLDQELLPYEILGPLGPQYEELQRILDFLPESSRSQLLGIALSLAINSDNPVETMQKRVIEYRKSKRNIMMLNDLTQFYGGDQKVTKEILKYKDRIKKNSLQRTEI